MIGGVSGGIDSIAGMVSQAWIALTLICGTTLNVVGAENFTLRVWQVRDGLPQNQVTAITQTPDGYLWFGTLNGLARFDGTRFRVFDHTNTKGMESSRVEGLELDDEGRIEVVLEEGRVGRFGETGFEPFQREPSDDRPELRAIEDVDAKTVSAKGGEWIAGERRLRRFVGGEVVEDYGPYSFAAPLRIVAMLEDREGRLWLATDGDGVLCYHGVNSADEFRGAEGLPENRVRCLFEDRDGNVWAGTDGGGVVRFRPRMFRSPVGSSGLVGERVNSVAVDGTDDIWIGTAESGLLVWDGTQHTAALSPDRNRIVTLLADASGLNVWVGTDGQGLFRVNRRDTESLFLEDREIAGLNETRVQALLEDRDGAIWVGTRNGLVRVEGERVEWRELGDGSERPDVRCLVQSADGSIWVGTHGSGLLRMDGRTVRKFDRKKGLADNYVWSLLAEEDGVIWVGTFGGGLSRFEDGIFQTLGVSHGLPDKVISSVLRDRLGDLWMGSQRGVFRVRRGELEDFFAGRSTRVGVSLFDVDDGLISPECVGGHQPSGVAARTGEMIFATTKGLAMIDPAALAASSEAPPVVIESVLLNDTRVFESLPGRREAGRLEQAIQVGPGRARIGINFAGMDFAKPDKIAYRYRLSGRDEDWVEAGGQRTAIFEGLRPGDYRFEVVAAKADGTSSMAPASVAFQVIPFFWQTLWFRVAAVLGMAGLIGWIVRLVSLRRIRRQMERLERELAIQNERTRIANDMHDDLGARLTRLAFLSDLAQRDTGSVPGENRLVELGEAARETAASLDELVWTVNPKNDRLDRLINYMIGQAREFCEDTGLRCQVDAPRDIPDLEVNGDFRHNLFLVVKEAMNNVAKHAQAERVELRIRVNDERLDISVNDDGCGFDVEAHRESGNGLGNYDDRISALNGTVNLQGRPGEGTRLDITVPLPPIG